MIDVGANRTAKSSYQTKTERRVVRRDFWQAAKEENVCILQFYCFPCHFISLRIAASRKVAFIYCIQPILWSHIGA